MLQEVNVFIKDKKRRDGNKGKEDGSGRVGGRKEMGRMITSQRKVG